MKSAQQHVMHTQTIEKMQSACRLNVDKSNNKKKRQFFHILFIYSCERVYSCNNVQSSFWKKWIHYLLSPFLKIGIFLFFVHLFMCCTSVQSSFLGKNEFTIFSVLFLRHLVVVYWELKQRAVPQRQ